MDILIVEMRRRTIGFARFQKRGGALLFQGAERRSWEDPEDLASILGEFGAATGAEDRVILSLDLDHLFQREVELPISDRRKLREVLPLELKGEIALDTEGLAFDAVTAGDGTVIAVWAKESELDGKIAVMKEAGLEPQVVGSSLFAWDLLVPGSAGNGSLALCDGLSLTVYSQGRPLLFRFLDDENVSEEITRTLALLEVGKGIHVEKVFLHGPAAVAGSFLAASGSPAAFSFEPLPVTGDLAASFSGESTALEYAGAWALAKSSLRGEPVNFRHGRLAYTAGREKIRKKLRLTALLISLFFVLLIVETGLRYYFVKRDLSSLNASISQIYREVFPTRKKAVDEVSELKSEIRRLGGGAAGQDTLAAMNAVARTKGADVFGVYELEVREGQVILKGDARSYQAANDFKVRLAELCTGAELSEVKSRPDGSVSFALRGTLREESK